MNHNKMEKELIPICDALSYQECDLVLKAYLIAKEELTGISRGDGSEFINHALGVATILSKEFGLLQDSIAALFLHEASRLNNSLLSNLKKEFSSDVLNIAESLNKLSEIKPKDTGLQPENYRKLIVSYSKDPRVVLIKLADRLEIMRKLEIFPKSKQLAKATETSLLYVPLAHQLGLYNLKSELEVLSFKHTEPDNYRLISNKLKANDQEAQIMLNEFVKPILSALDDAGIVYRLKSRTKSSYSIWKKMQSQQIPFESVSDIYAIRFILDTPIEAEKESCWKVYSIVTDKYTPITERLRDWITVPKSNGYESLHTTVTALNGEFVEVQIRSERMDISAEVGNASHWSYKGVKKEKSIQDWLVGVKKLLDSPHKQTDEELESFSMDEIFVFTPDGDLRRLTNGASVLDYAFDIHTNLGIKCSGAKINGKPASIREKLKTGDVVEIISSKNQRPSRDWLNYVISSKARAKIKQKLKEEESKVANIGRELLVRRMNNWKLELNDEVLGILSRHFKFKTVIEFYSALANNSINIIEVKNFLTEKELHSDAQPSIKESSAIQQKEQKSREGSSDYLIIDDKLNNVGYKLSKCCNPINGDEVFGFVSVKDGIKIHRLNCPNAERLITNYPYRIQKVKWREGISGQNFQVTLRISGFAEGSIDRQLVEVVGTFPVSVRLFSINEHSGKFESKLQLSVPNNNTLDQLIFAIKRLKGVKSVSRI